MLTMNSPMTWNPWTTATWTTAILTFDLFKHKIKSLMMISPPHILELWHNGPRSRSGRPGVQAQAPDAGALYHQSLHQ